MEIKKTLPQTREVHCFNIINNKKDKKYGMVCERLLICRNSDNSVAGEIKCPRCSALYDIKNDELILINRG